MTEETIIAPAPPNRITPGHRLNEIYEIDSLLATGGMGEVYRGHAIETGDHVAIKTIRPEFAQNTAALTLFKKEASALRNLYHEAIVRYFVFSIDKGIPYLAMEFVEGKSLSDYLNKGALDLEQLRVLQKRLASGLHAAHELGIIHRDVSPDNIILPGENLARAKIIDFGIARSTQSEGTVIGSGFAGKFGYVSPEQLGLYGGDVGPQSDIYSLGLVLAEAALGKAIDMGHSHVDVIDKRRRIPDLSALDARFRPLIEWMLQPDPKDRAPSMAEVAEWMPAGGRAAAKAGRSPDSGGGGKKRTGLAVAAALAVVAALGGGAYVLLPQLRTAGSSSEAPTVASQSARTDTAMLPDTAPLRPTSSNSGLGSEALLPPPPPPASSAAPAKDASTEPFLPSDPAPAAPSSPSPVSSSSPPPVSSSSPPAVVQPPSTASPAPPQQTARLEPPASQLPAPSAPPIGTPSTEPSAVSPRVPPSVEQVTSFLRDYRGGECFYLAPTQLALREAKIEAFGVTTAPFVAFDSAFQRSLGFEPDISLRQVTSTQCPIVDFLAQRTAQRGHRPPRLTIRSDRLRSGQELVGSVEGAADGNVDVLLVADDGLVHNLTPYLKRTGDTISFSLRVEANSASEKPQLVVAIASPRPLSALKSTNPMSSDRLSRQLAEEARNGQISGVATRYFKIGP